MSGRSKEQGMLWKHEPIGKCFHRFLVRVLPSFYSCIFKSIKAQKKIVLIFLRKQHEENDKQSVYDNCSLFLSSYRNKNFS